MSLNIVIDTVYILSDLFALLFMFVVLSITPARFKFKLFLRTDRFKRALWAVIGALFFSLVSHIAHVLDSELIHITGEILHALLMLAFSVMLYSIFKKQPGGEPDGL